MRTLCLKVDVCTREGMRLGVPRLLEQLARHHAKATFCLAFGPDQSGRAVFNAFQPGFAKKMLRSGAGSLYGWRTMLSGTLLPARPVASDFPGLLRRLDAEGHETALHGWNHRRWQDHVNEMDDVEVREHLDRAATAYESILGRRPRGTAAPAWSVTPQSLAIADNMGFAWASDLRAGTPCRLRAAGQTMTTPQIPTTGRCVEELLAAGVRGPAALVAALEDDLRGAEPAVLAVHAEVEGGPHAQVLDALLPRLRDAGFDVRTLGELVASRPASSWPVHDLAFTELPGRSGRVATSR